MRTLVTAALLASVAMPAGTIAQNPPQPTQPSQPPAPESRERTFTFRWGPGSDDHMTLMHRGRLGITVDMRADAARDTVGALIAGVLPGGAADRAGLHAGDVVVRFNGTRLAAPATNADDADSDQSRPAMRLIKIASRLDPGDTVMLDVRRDGRPQTFMFQAEESDMDMLASRMEPAMSGMAEAFPPMLGDMMDKLPGRFSVSFGGALSDIELVKVNPDLGQYFGTTDGLLVTNVGSDSALGLKAGDVILAIGGRHPTSPAHAMRILSTYDPGETIAFEVMRQRHRTTINGHMPQPGDHSWRVHRNSFTIPITPRLPFMDGDAPMIMIRAKRAQQIET